MGKSGIYTATLIAARAAPIQQANSHTLAGLEAAHGVLSFAG